MIRRSLGGLALAPMLLLARPATGQLVVPSVTVNGTDVFSGPQFTVPNALSASAPLSLVAAGTVYLQNNGGVAAYGTNPAGVVTVAGSTGIGGTSANGATNYGALLLGNSTLGFFQLFPANAANGLGSAAPPTSLTLNTTVGAVFGSGLNAGTVLEFRVSDTNTGDNSGSYSIRPLATTATPEPATLALVAGGLALIAGYRRRVRG